MIKFLFIILGFVVFIVWIMMKTDAIKPHPQQAIGPFEAWILFLTTRLAYMVCSSRAWVHADFEYGEIARNWMTTGRWAMTSGPHVFLSAHEPPMLSLLIILFTRLFGHGVFYEWVWCAWQFEMGALCFYLFLKLVHGIFPDYAAVWAILLYLLDPNLFSCLRWLNETVYTQAFILGSFLLWSDSGIVAGALLGLASLFRGTFILEAPYFLRSRWTGYLVMACCLSPWIYRNYIVFHRPVIYHEGIDLWTGWNEQSVGGLARADGTPLTDLHPLRLKVALKAATSETDVDRAYRTDALVHFRLSRWALQRAGAFCFFWHEQTFWTPYSPYRTSKTLLLGILNLMFVAAFFYYAPFAWKSGFRSILYFIAIHCAIFTLVHADIGNRYRVSIDPLMIIVIVEGIFAW